MIVEFICPTRFALGNIRLPEVREDEVYYKVWHPLVDKMTKNGELEEYFAESNRMIYFDWQTFHEGTKAIKDGWRWFGRASWNSKRVHQNEIRKQVQVYLEFPMEGW